MPPPNDDLIADIRAYLRACDDHARLTAAFERGPTVAITFYSRPRRRSWFRRWLKRGKR